MRWLKNAFAVDPPGPTAPTDAEKQAAEWVCREIVRRHLTTPALLFLESWRPMNYLSAQAMHFFAPAVSVLADTRQYTVFAEFLAKRGSVDYLCSRIEELEAQFEQADGKRAEETETPPQS